MGVPHNLAPATLLYRVGLRTPETAEWLDRQAKEAAADPAYGVLGVSVRTDTPGAFRRTPTYPAATVERVEQHFPVVKTGPDDYHYTVVLPDPVTEEMAETFNRIFGRVP